MEEKKAVAGASASASKPKTSSKEAVDKIKSTGTRSLKSPASAAQIKESEELKIEEEEATAAEIQESSTFVPDRILRRRFPKDMVEINASGAAKEDKPLRESEELNIEADRSLRRRWNYPKDMVEINASGAAKEDKPLKHGSARSKVIGLIIQVAILIWFSALVMWAFLGGGKPLHFCKIVWLHSLVLLQIIWIIIIIFFNRMYSPFDFTVYELAPIAAFGFLPAPFLAAFLHAMLNPAIGMFIIQLITHITAGFLGYTVARYYHGPKNREKKPLHVLPMSAIHREKKPLHVLPMSAILIHALLNFGVVFRLVWLLSHSADYTSVDLMIHFQLSILIGLLLWIIFIAVALENPLLGEEGLTLVIFYFFFSMLQYILSVVTLGHIWATLTTWYTVLVLSGVLGYFIGTYNDSTRVSALHRYRQAYRIIRRFLEVPLGG